MKTMKQWPLAACLVCLVLAGCSQTTTTTDTGEYAERTLDIPESAVSTQPPAAAESKLPGQGEDAGKTVVYRDTWGVAHIYAPTVEAGMYAMGWAQAEDRPEQLLKNFMMAVGASSEYEGRGGVQTDLRSHLWDHYGVAQRFADQTRPDVRAHVRAFAKGINDYYAAHPEDKPAWWGDRQVDEFMVVAFGRLFLYNWSIDEGYGDLRRAGIQPGFEPAQRGSNQWAVSPSRSAVGAAILCIDPHLSWWGTSRFWEFRIHAGELHGSGVTLPGSPYIGLGHNQDLAWAMTTGGPDTADVYELILKEDDPTKYLYDGEWRDIFTREVTLNVKDEGPQTHTLRYSHHGPIVAIRNGKAYAIKISYADVANVREAWYHLNFAKDYQGAVAAMDTLTVFPQNVMVADTSGNIYYQRTGRVPKRPDGYDWSLPVDGSTSASEWLGIHPASDHLQVLNPPRGYMQNCNIPPDAMIPNSPFKLEGTIGYLFASLDYGAQRSGWTNQRGARAIQLLQADDSVTIEEALAYAVDMVPYGAARWVGALRAAHEKFGAQFAENPDYTAAMQDILDWDLELRPDSTGALKYYYWRKQLVDDYGQDAVNEAARGVDDWYHIVEGREPKPVELTDEQLQSGLASFTSAMAALKEHFGSLDAVYGDKFRVGRDDQSWPVGGGGDYGTRTLRSMGFGPEQDDHTRWGRSGQTSTQIVVLTKPIQSWMYIPIGNSDRPDSPHYRDQAEKVFSPARLKPTWWRPEDLAQHVESRTVLEGAP